MRRLVACCALLLSLSCLPGWAQLSATLSTTSPQAVSAPSSMPIEVRNKDGTINWDSLVRASDTLATEAEALQNDLAILQTQYNSLLKLSKDTDVEAQKVMQRQESALWWWRAGAATALILDLLLLGAVMGGK